MATHALPARPRGQRLALARLRLASLRSRASSSLRSRASVVTLACAMAGFLGGAALVGLWCLGLALMAECVAAAWVALNRDDGQPAGGRTWGEVLGVERTRP